MPTDPGQPQPKKHKPKPQPQPKPKPAGQHKPKKFDPFAGVPTGKPGYQPPIDRAQRKAKRAEAKARRWLGQHSNRGAAIKRRQAILRSAGYKIAVDGVWGPQSQRAWHDFQTRRSQGDKTLGAPYAIPKGSLPAPPKQLQQSRAAAQSQLDVARQRAAAARQAAIDARRQAQQAQDRAITVESKKQQARQAAQAEVAAQRAAIKRVSQQIQTDPNSAATLTLRQLTDSLVDPQVGVAVTSHAGALAVQTWLNHNGYHVERSGAYNKATHDALMRALHDEQRRIRQQQNEAVLTQLYQPSHLRVGDDAPDWMYGIHGKVPQPGQLVHILQHGGFAASVLYRSLLDHAKDGNWRNFQHDQLLRIASKIQPFALLGNGIGAGPSNDFLYSQLRLSASQMQLSPYDGKYGARDQARRQASLVAQVDALYQAKDAHDFKRKLTAYTAVQEQIALREEQKAAAHHVGFFGHALHDIVAPGQFMRTAMVADTHLLLGTLDPSANSPGFLDYIRMSDDQRADIWDRAVQAQEHANPALNFTYQLFADPLWLAKPFKVGSSLVRYAGDTGILGSRVGGITAQLGRYTFEGDTLLGKTYDYTKGTWTRGQLATHLADTFAYGLSGHPYSGSKLSVVVDRSLRLKGDALDRARGRVGLAMRHGFRKPSVPVAGQIDHFAPDAKLTQRLSDSLAGLKGLHATDPSGELQKIVDVLSEHEASLFMDSGRTVYSQVGASLVARASEAYRVHIARRIAAEASRDVLAAGGSKEDAIREFERIRGLIGSHVAGAPTKDLAPAAFADANGERLTIHDVLRKQVAARMDEFENTLVFTWQEILEERAMQAGKQLFDERGLWAGRLGESASKLREAAAATFRDTIDMPNPLYNVAHTWAEASPAIEDEIRRLSARALQYDERLAVGQLPNEFNVKQTLAEIRDTVEKAWKRGPDGMYRDSRDTLSVSPLYARHMEEAITGGKATADDFLTQIAAFPKDVFASASSPLDTAIDRLTWRLGGRSKVVNFGARIHPADTSHLIGNLTDAEVQFTDLLSQAVAEHQDALAQAYDLAMPQAMKGELAAWQALAHAQSKPLKFLYGAINGGLQLWITATLPLRPAWVVRNVIDNFCKTLIAGLHDPRILFLGAENPGSHIRTLFDFGVYPMRQSVHFLDQLFGTDVLTHFDALMGHFWELPASVLRRIFDAHGISVPESAIEDMKQDFLPKKASVGGRPHVDGEAADKPFYRRPIDVMYEMMGNRPENYFKRVIYRDTVKAETERLRRLPAYRNAQLGKQPVKVTINDAEARRLLEKYTGNVSGDIEVVIDYVPRDVIKERGWGTFHPYKDLAAERQVHGEFLNHYLIVRIPDDVRVLGHQGAQKAANFYTDVFLHELRHGTQFSRASGKLDWFVKRQMERLGGSDGAQKLLGTENAKDFFYRYQPLEIDARMWSRFRRSLGKDLVSVTDHAGNPLPSIYDDVAIAQEAHRVAIQKVADTLFDYSKVTVLEDNFRVFFPFIQFWRKNLGFWATHTLDKPWLPAAYAKWEQDMNDKHSDLPAWMRRYVNSSDLVDAAAVVPGLDKVVEFIIPQNAQYDPLKFSSVAPLYRSFLSLMGGDENGNLPPGEGHGWAVIGPMLDAMNQWGLGSNPLIEKPLEVAGVASDKAWQTIFPQAGPIIALNPEFWLNRQGSGPIEWGRIAALYAMTGSDGDGIAKNMNYYIQAEIAGQVARGEKPDRARATKVIEDWFLTQNLVGYFGGMYLRRATQQDIYLSTLYDDAVTGKLKNPTSREKELLKLWAMRGMSRYAFDKYLEVAPQIQTYYRLPDFQAAQDYLDQHPELTQYVDPTWRGQPFSHDYIKQAVLRYNADTFFRVSQLSDTLDVAHDVKQYAQQLLLTPEIQKMWEENRTPAERQRRMLEGLIHKQLNDVNDAYFSIPESNDAARRDYLKQHPELIRLWNANNNAADDYEAILHDANAELRQRFFNLIHHGHHEEADAFLAKHPFLWEDTTHADHFDPHTGQLKLQYMSDKARAYMEAKGGFDKLDRLIRKVGKKAAWNWLYNSEDPDAKAARDYIRQYGQHKMTSEHAKDYLAAKSALDHYFGLPKSERSAWLRSDDPQAAVVRAYLNKWGTQSRSEHALDYLKVRAILKAYFAMPKGARDTWLHGDSPEARQLRAYFKKWASDKGMTQHARDYLDVKSALDRYFALPKSRRSDWLKSGGPEAKKVLAYFKKYGSFHKYERAFAKIDPQDVGGTPEQRQRLLFWKRYFALTPDKRPAFIHDHAEQYGVFIYGPLSQTKRDAQEQAWLRRAHGAHFTPKQLDYLYVKPLLDFYFSLKSSSEKRLFMQANPELSNYFAEHPPHVHTGNPKLDAEVEAYFKLDVTLRSPYLMQHPEVQRWLDTKGTPADRAIHSLLSQYFALTGRDRADFAASHPEISAFFAARLLEKQNLSAATQALYEADPRLAPYRNNVEDMIGSANRQLDRLRAAAMQSFTPDTIEGNRDRTAKYTGHSTGRHRQKKAASNVAPDSRARG